MIHLFIIYPFLAPNPFTSALPARAASNASMAIRLPPAEAKYNGVEPRLLRASSMSPAFKGKQTATLNRGVRCEEHSWIFEGGLHTSQRKTEPTTPGNLLFKKKSWKSHFVETHGHLHSWRTNGNLLFW